MPDKNISSAKCHMCGNQIPFTYGNPKELIQHMLGCHEQETTQQFNPSSSVPSPPNNKPCVKIVDCPNKRAKCTTCGGVRQTEGKSATLYDAPEDAPIKCTICVAPTKDGSCKPECLSVCAAKNKRSSFKNNKNDDDDNNNNDDGDGESCLPNCPNKSSRINLGDFTSPIKLRIRCKSSKSNDNKPQEKRLSQSNDRNKVRRPSLQKTETSKNKFDVKPKNCKETGKRRTSSGLDNKSKPNICSSPVGQNRRLSNVSQDSAALRRRSSSLAEMNKTLAPSVNRRNDSLRRDSLRRDSLRNDSLRRDSLQSDKIKRKCSSSLTIVDKNKEPSVGKYLAQEKTRRLSNTSPTSFEKSTTLCNKTVCFAANTVDKPEDGKPYSPCNLVKRKGTKEMFKTTLETWTAGCGTINCPKCRRKVVPLIRKKKNKIAFSSVGASLLLTCWPFCFLIPMLHNCSVDLYCPCCKYKLGVYNSSTGETTSVCCKENSPNT